MSGKNRTSPEKNRTTGSRGHVRKIWDWPQPVKLQQQNREMVWYRFCETLSYLKPDKQQEEHHALEVLSHHVQHEVVRRDICSREDIWSLHRKWSCALSLAFNSLTLITLVANPRNLRTPTGVVTNSWVQPPILTISSNLAIVAKLGDPKCLISLNGQCHLEHARDPLKMWTKYCSEIYVPHNDTATLDDILDEQCFWKAVARSPNATHKCSGRPRTIDGPVGD